MLTIKIHGEELFDEETNQFITIDEATIHLEHSLVSLSKWESKYKKPFLSSTEKTEEEVYDYIRCMVVSPEGALDGEIILSNENLERIQKHIGDTRSATTFNELPQQSGAGRRETITSELIYYWMVAFNVPIECETWHLNRLFSLLKICNIKNSKGKKIPKNEIARRNRELNEKRKAELNTRG